jgi:hypothetical protein
MFIGHFGVGFGAKPVAPGVSLGWLFFAAQFLDLLWPVLLLLNVEQVRIQPGATAVTPLVFESYPVSHSLLAATGWGILVATIYFLLHKSWRGAAVLGIAVISHWLLDALVHAPDLPLYPGSPQLIGLELWSSLPATLAVELTIFALGVWLYCRSTKALDRSGRWGFWSLVTFLLLVYFGNLFGPPPPDSNAIAWAGQSQWLLVLWGWWVDKHRSPRN